MRDAVIDSPLMEILKQKIAKEGPMNIGDYMDLAMGHPEYGYYVTRDPLGRQGDFVTAPEVSQMFGELIGAFFIFTWEKFGKPKKVNLVEFGPGRGTLMADMIRTIKNAFDEFHDGVQIHLVEISPVLRKRQAESLLEYEPIWHDDLSTVPEDEVLFMVGNEFLDVLPLRQFVFGPEGWQERFVSHDESQGLHYVSAPSPDGFHEALEFEAPEGEVFELAPARNDFIKNLCEKMRKTTGSALMIDYGYLKSDVGNSFQALKDKKPCDVLEHVGEADLTSQVDFEFIQKTAEHMGATIGAMMGPPTTQAEFLKMLHIDHRKEVLMGETGEQHAERIEQDYHRLLDAEEMGELFKVIEFGFWP